MRSLSCNVFALVSLLTALPVMAATVPGDITVVSNPYGPLTVQGATYTGNTITNSSTRVEIRLGSVPGTPGAVARFDVDGLNLGPEAVLTFTSGAPNQVVLLVNTSSVPASYAGGGGATFGGGAYAPFLYIKSASGMTIETTGAIAGGSGLRIDTLGDSWTEGRPLINRGVLIGDPYLDVLASDISGEGQFRGNAIDFHTFGNARQPRDATHFLQNWLRLLPSANNPTNTVALSINAYGSAPQFLNFKVENGNVKLSMPSAWNSGTTIPDNNAVVAPGTVRPATAPDPAYGGGSLIVQADGKLTLDDAGSGTDDFVFPGAIVLKAAAAMDLNGILLNQGWTTSGAQFQGLFLEAPSIASGSGIIELYTNGLNWVNFSTLPTTPVRVFALTRNSDGTASFAPADATAPHINTYSVIANTAADGGCWTCLIDPVPVDVYGP